jgi:superfamily II DNA/RNA helicase
MFKIHNKLSDRSLKQRTVAIRNFKEGLFDVLVATDVAARGLNIPQVDHVVGKSNEKKNIIIYFFILK